MYSSKEKIDFIQKVFGKCVVSSDGINVAVACPSCGSQSKSKKKLSIRIDTDVTHCWICGLKSRSLAPIIKKYFSRAHLEEYYSKFRKDSLISTSDDSEEEVQITLPKGFVLLGASQKSLDPDIRAVIRYVTRRGLSYRDMWYYRLGTCTSGKFRRRVIIPSFDFEGRLNYYVGRAIDRDETRRYVNARVPRSTIVFNEINIDWSLPLTLVEGPFDLMKCDDNTVPLLGSSLPRDSSLFNRIISNKTPVILALDSDMSKKTQKIASDLSEYDVKVKILDTSNHEDVGAMTNLEFLKLKREARAWKREDKLLDLIGGIMLSSSVRI